MSGLSWLLWSFGSWAAEVPASPMPTADAPLVDRVVWGDVPFPVEGEIVDVVFDAAGRPCAVDDGGVVCFDDAGGPAWALDIAGVEEVIEADGAWALRVGEDVVVVDDQRGRVLAQASDAWAARTASGRLVLADPAGFGSIEGAPTPWRQDPGPLAGVLAREDGGLGLVHPDGTVTWVGPDGAVESEMDWGLAAEAGVLAEPLPDGGFVVLDDAGVVLVGPEGEIRAEILIPGSDLSVDGGELRVAADDGVWGVDPRTGVVDAVPEAPAASAVVARGARLVTASGDRLRVWDDADEVGANGHLGPVVRLAAGPAGALGSVDTTGRAVLWSAAGEPRVLPWRGVRDVAFAGGQPWVALGDRAVGVAGPGRPAREAPGPATWLVGLPDGLLIGDGSALRRLDGAGKVRWTTPAPHDRRPSLSMEEGVVLVVGAGVDVIDLETGVRRRRLYEPGAAAAGVSVGGLVVWTEDAMGTTVGRPTSSRGARLSGRGAAPSPAGRWAVTAAGRTLYLEDGEGTLLYRAEAVGAPRSWLATEDVAWVGLDDGRVERWVVSEVVAAASPAAFGGYAQVDPWKQPPSGPAPVTTWEVGVGARRLVAGELGGAVVLGGGVLELSPGKPPRQMVLPDHFLPASIAWDSEHGFVVGGEDGRLRALAGEELGAATSPARDVCRVPGGWLIGGPALQRVSDEGEAAGWALASTRIACDPTGRQVGLRRADVALVGDPEEGAWTTLLHAGPVRSLARASDGSWATGGEDEVVILWDPRSLSAAYVLEGHGAPVVALASARGRLLAGAGDRAILWDLATLRATAAWKLTDLVVDVALAPDGRSAFAMDARGRVLRWTLPEPAPAADPDLEGIPRFDVVPPPAGLPAR